MAFPNYPYTDFHRLNGDYLLEQVAAAKQDAADSAASAAEAAATAAEAGAAALNAVQFVEQGLTNSQKAQARTNIGAVGPDDVPTLDTVVQVTAQSFNNAQKSQARDNIGAASSDSLEAMADDVVTLSEQTLTSAQKTQARTNIGAASASDLGTLASSVAVMQSAVTNKVDVNEGSAIDLKIVSSVAAGQGYGAILHGIGVSGAGKLSLNQVVSGAEVSAKARLGVGYPVTDDDAVTKVYADTKVSKSNAEILDRVRITNTQNGAGYIRLEAEYDSGTQVNSASINAYDSEGISEGLAPLSVGEPVGSADAATKAYADGYIQTLVGTTKTITPAKNTRYKCGNLSSLTITDPPATGSWAVTFSSGSTPTTTTIPAAVIFPEPFAAEANTRYEINVEDGYAVVVGWPIS